MRTEYAGLVDAKFVGQTVTLFGWVHRRRDHGGVIFIDLRDREGLVQVVCDPDRAGSLRAGGEGAQRVLPEDRGHGAQASGRHGQHQPRLGRDRGAGPGTDHPEPVRRHPVPARRRQPVGDHAPDASRAGPAPPADAEEPDAALQGRDGGPQVPRRARLRRHRDADAHEEHAGRRARLPRAVARARRRVLRAAAVAAAVQAAADDRRLRPLLPDRQVLPRRGPARRPPARVHADRRRDVLPRRDRDPRADGGDDPHRVRRGAGRQAAEPVPGDDLRRGDAPVRLRQAGPAREPRARPTSPTR